MDEVGCLFVAGARPGRGGEPRRVPEGRGDGLPGPRWRGRGLPGRAGERSYRGGEPRSPFLAGRGGPARNGDGRCLPGQALRPRRGGSGDRLGRIVGTVRRGSGTGTAGACRGGQVTGRTAGTSGDWLRSIRNRATAARTRRGRRSRRVRSHACGSGRSGRDWSPRSGREAKRQGLPRVSGITRFGVKLLQRTGVAGYFVREAARRALRGTGPSEGM